MGKKSGKKQNKTSKGAGVKVPDAKNGVSSDHKQEDKLVHGENTASDAGAATTAKASGSAIVPETTTTTTAAAAPANAAASETQEMLKEDTSKTQPSAATAEKEDAKESKVKEKDTTKKKQRGDKKTKALAAAVPTGSKAGKKEEEPSEAKTTNDHPTTLRSTDRPDMLADSRGKNEQSDVSAMIAGLSEAVPDMSKKDQIALETGAAAVTLGTAALAGGKAAAASEDQAQSADSDLETKDTQQKPSLSSANTDQTQEDATTHAKRSHEVPIFANQDRDQLPKKPRVDDSNETSASRSNQPIPGGYPSPSFSGSRVSGVDGIIVSETQGTSKGAVTDKSDVTGAAASPRAAVSQQEALNTRTNPATTAPSEGATLAEDKNRSYGVSKTNTTGQDKTTTSSAVSRAGADTNRPTAETVPPNKESASFPRTRPNADAAAVPQTQPSTGTRAEQPLETQFPASKEPPQEASVSQSTQLEPTKKEAKKGGFLAWLRRKFRGDKVATTDNGR